MPLNPPALPVAALAFLAFLLSTSAQAFGAPPALRVATFNTSLNDDNGHLITRLRDGDENARKIAAVIQRVRPDLLLLNEFDFDAAGEAADLFDQHYLQQGQFGEQPIRYPHRYLAPVNTGVPSGLDLDRNGEGSGGNDAWGYGRHPGQYGMLVLSRFPIDADQARTFQHLRWSSMPNALRPQLPDGSGPYYPDAIWTQLRLSSKSHWDVPVHTALGTVHFLVAHPTPPVFDGPENRNGLRNHDEIRLWAEYLSPTPGDWLIDDAGHAGGLAADAHFIIAGDQNADPLDGSGVPDAIKQLLDHPRVLRYPAPRGAGGAAASARDGGVNLGHQTDPAEDTSAFGPSSGNMRVDYVLPSNGFEVVDSGVFWPLPDQPGGDWLDATDHRMVWLDLRLPPPKD